LRELDACRFEGALNSKTLFICRRAKSVLNLPEQANAETCSRAEPVARPTEKLPRGLNLSAGDHFPALRGFGALSFRRSAAYSPRSINRRIGSGPDGFGSGCASIHAFKRASRSG